ncbi:hypothetical protein AAFF_G00039390 [Aldrovandia affinis]|uniref:Inward rectifier potassium channel C-terminal domain-containing protein n=1 Tax=Aldrovandia affinis TaxID=143900 RepID=A0AAD7S2Y3_9TELE|nr:hypothetical protein AAFF_G00039390 [Aldrovandia affinis]
MFNLSWHIKKEVVIRQSCIKSSTNTNDQPYLIFWIGHLRDSHMVNAKVRAKVIKSWQTPERELLPLGQSEIDLGYEIGSDCLFNQAWQAMLL